MKTLRVQKVRGPIIEIHVDPKSPIETAQEILISKHNFPQGQYKFIYNGQILRNPEPFSGLKEGSRIIVYIKEETEDKSANPAETSESLRNPPQQQQQQQQPPGQSQQSPSSQAQQPAQAQAGAPQGLSPQQQALSQQQQALSQQQQQQQIHRQQFANIVRSAFDITLMSQLYNPENNFWNHPKELSEIAEIVRPSSMIIMENFLILHFTQTFRYCNITPELIYDIIGCERITTGRIIDDIDAAIEMMSDNQREGFKRLLELGYEKGLTFETFQACSFNEEQTANCLTQMPKE